MLFNVENWALQQNVTNCNQFQPRATQQRLPSTTTSFSKQNDSRMSRRYSSGTPTSLQSGFSPIVQQPTTRRVNKGTYRSATFHNPQQNPLESQQFPLSNSPTNRSAQKNGGGQLRPSSSFHGCIQHQNPQNIYSGRNSYNGLNGNNGIGSQLVSQQPPKQSLYAVSGQFKPGMKDVPAWLKSLRLHKYTRMFQEMSYEEMMSLDDQRLEQRQVTKGARKKILQSLEKLRDRSQLIRQLEKCIDENGDVRCLIVELRAMMCTPIAAYRPLDLEPIIIDAIGMAANEVDDENLPGHISRCCLRLHEFLFRNGLPQIHELGIEDEYLVKLLQIYDKIYSNESFTFRQRYFINECKRILSRYIMEQKIVLNSVSFGAQPMPSQPTLVSSPSSGYHTISPPSTRRRSSDTKESVDDLTATATTATNSDDDGFHGNLSSAPTSPPPQHLNFQQFQQNQWTQQLPKSSQCPPPGFEWLSNNQSNSQSNRQNVATTNPHFQPYVNDQQFEKINSIGSIPQKSQGWYGQSDSFGNSLRNQWTDVSKAIMEADSDTYGYMIQHLQQHQRQNPSTTSTIKPPKAPSPIGTRPNGYVQKVDASNDPLMPLTVADKLRFLASDSAGSEILENVVQEAMNKLSLQRQRNEVVIPSQTMRNEVAVSSQTMLWQNVKEPKSQQLNNWWNTPTSKQQVPNAPIYPNERRPPDSNNFFSANNVKPKLDYYDHWSYLQAPKTQHQDLLSSVDQLTTSTSSNLSSDANLFQNGSNSSSTARVAQNYPSHIAFDPLTSISSEMYQSNLSNSSSSTQSNYNYPPMTSLVNDTDTFQPISLSTRPLEQDSKFDSNLLNRMLNDNHLCGGQSQKQQQRIMQQYAAPDDLNLRAMLDSHQQEQLFAAFRPLACSASGAVH